ncbi:MAG TPA: hypothetical protein VHW01_12805, partial [Polyangiaceae bacterium]|nr:hypothetical protein [Polyangiaceae bacterium]
GGAMTAAGGGTTIARDADQLGDGTQLTASLEIPAGSTVTIPAGASITAASGVVITVRGVLSIASPDVHARIATAMPNPDQAHSWGGIVVESGGSLEADGLDLTGAATALTVNAGSLGARYDDGTIADAQVPFQIAVGARLDTAHAAVVNAGDASSIAGEFHASYLDYDTSSSVVAGLLMTDPTAIFDATDSTFHGSANAGNDYIVSDASSLVHVAYSTITDAHCAFHFNAVTRFEIDHVTAGASSPAGPGSGVVYGAMLYGSGAGPNIISNSNFMGAEVAFDQASTNGPLTISNTFAQGRISILPTSTWLPADVAPAPISDAKPR